LIHEKAPGVLAPRARGKNKIGWFPRPHHTTPTDPKASSNYLYFLQANCKRLFNTGLTIWEKRDYNTKRYIFLCAFFFIVPK
jgi:hypothetical protein